MAADFMAAALFKTAFSRKIKKVGEKANDMTPNLRRRGQARFYYKALLTLRLLLNNSSLALLK